jgi:hypothetical protein
MQFLLQVGACSIRFIGRFVSASLPTSDFIRTQLQNKILNRRTVLLSCRIAIRKTLWSATKISQRSGRLKRQQPLIGLRHREIDTEFIWARLRRHRRVITDTRP